MWTITYGSGMLLLNSLGALNVINIWEHSSLFKAMINGEHYKLDFDFDVGIDVDSEYF